MQVDSIKTLLKAPMVSALEAQYNGALSNFAYNFNLRHHTLVAMDLWAAGEDQAVDRVHFELTSAPAAAAAAADGGGGAGAPDALLEESLQWAWVERSAWATVSATWYSLFTGMELYHKWIGAFG